MKNLLLVEQHISESELRTLQLLLRQSPDPDSAVHYLERFIVEGGATVDSLFRSKNRLPALLTIFSHSHSLTETLFRYPQLLDWALDSQKFYRVLSAEELRTDLGWLSAELDHSEAARSLARFKKMHLLRISLRDLLGLATLAEVTLELSNLADALLQGAHEYLHQ